MHSFGQGLKTLFLSVTVVVLLFIVLAKLSQWTTPTAVQRETVAFMERDDLPQGRDAFALAWTLHRDVPLDEIDAVAAADVERAANWMDHVPDSPGADLKMMDLIDDWRRDDYPTLSHLEDRDVFCSINDEEGCLTKVRAAPASTAEAIARNQPLLERALRYRETEVLRNPFAGGLADPYWSIGSATLPMTSHALQFVQGDQEAAIRETCLDLATWRRLAVQTDSLVTWSAGIQHVGRGWARLLADMLGEYPLGDPLPAACEPALAVPLDRELLLCNAIRGEFRLMRGRGAALFEWSRHQAPWYDRAVQSVFWHDESTNALFAEMLAPFCRTDRPGAPDHDWPEPGPAFLARWSCVGNIGGCSTVGLAHGGLENYKHWADWNVDFGARLRLLGALAWMREQGAATGKPAGELIDQLPREFTDSSPPVQLAPGGHSLRVDLKDTRYSEGAEVALPKALLPGGA